MSPRLSVKVAIDVSPVAYGLRATAKAYRTLADEADRAAEHLERQAREAGEAELSTEVQP